ncbi:MAG: hypothetical protein K8F56_11740 [Rhodocyclaceae bacterium]|nr:hypothetical protein [Rhodocyclaceae bacterium]
MSYAKSRSELLCSLRSSPSRLSLWLLRRERAVSLFGLAVTLALVGPAIGWSLGLLLGWILLGALP